MADPLELDDTIFSRQHAMNSLAKCCRHNTNLASAQFGLKQLDDAAGSARCALRLEPEYPQAHFMLGLILSADTRTVHEGSRTCKRLRRPSPAHPRNHRS